MFTGLVEEVGHVVSLRREGVSAQVHIRAPRVADGLEIGDSVAVDGACLTAVSRDSQGFVAEVAHETLARTTLGSLRPGDPVNLERALAVGGRLGGHLVTGHVDGVGAVRRVSRDGIARLVDIDAPSCVMRYVVEKGSVAVAGISLTVVSRTRTALRISVIPHTLGETALAGCRVGDEVNLEADILGKYVEQLMGHSSPREGVGVSRELLAACGF